MARTDDEMSLNLEMILDKSANAGFRARAVSEYNRVSGWIGDKVNLEKARILDFGCGEGDAAASFALRLPHASVVGVDLDPVNETGLADRLRKETERSMPRNLRFITTADLANEKAFDVIYSWSVFEHVREDEMVDIFKQLKGLLRKGGVLFVQVNPLFFSPRGSHLYRYFKEPWHHLLLPLNALRDGVFAKGVTETHTREWQQFLELNRLTARDILGRASAAGLKRTREQFFKTEVTPPLRLTRVYNEEVLRTNEMMALFE
jgi:2-polyprenyl-3-methyl-5-hydroxy-6-metoxy-1,4-benzoquinol methylase